MLDFFFEPDGVVFIGISTKSGGESYNPLEVIKAFGYQGRVYAVNPKGGTVCGEKLYRSLEEINEPVELAVITVPRQNVLKVFQECIARRVKGVVIITQGFADADETGKTMQEEITRLAKDSGVRVVGPNTMGIINTFNRFSTGFVRFDTVSSFAGVASQSGLFLGGGPFLTGGFGLAIDLGNTADVNFAEVLRYYGEDERIRVISLHMEDVKEGREFIKAAGLVSRKKPILVLKTGNSEAGRKAAASHSGALAGEAEVYKAAFEQAGVMQVKNAQELYDLTRAFQYYSPIQNNRVAVITPAGGAGIMAIDACAEYGLEMASLLPETLACLRRVSPSWFEPGNPTDLWIASMAQGYAKTLQELLPAVLADPNVDALINVSPVISGGEENSLWARVIREILIPLAKKSTKPVLVWTYGGGSAEYNRVLEENGIMAFSSVERAVRVIAALYEYGAKIRNRPEPEYVSPVRSEPQKITEILARPEVSLRKIISILDYYGIPVASSYFARNLEEAYEAAREIGYPVVLKIFSPALAHKSDFGGVKLNIKNREELCFAYQNLLCTVQKTAPEADLQGVIVQPYLPGGVEVLAGIKRDPQFGPVIVYGSGGILAEIIADVSFRIAPVSTADVREMITSTRSYTFLRGVRGGSPVDLEALIETILRLSQMALEVPQIEELDLNPLAVFQKGVKALDVRAVMNPGNSFSV